MELMEKMMGVVKGGLIDGPTLYLTGKLFDVSDQVAFNAVPSLPDMVRMPLVGLALATIPVAMSDHWLAEKISEYTMAGAVASSITVAGAPQGNASGPLDQQINAMLLPIANINSAIPFTYTGFWGPTNAPGIGIKGYVDRKPAGKMNGYVAAGNRASLQGYLGANKVGDGAYRPTRRTAGGSVNLPAMHGIRYSGGRGSGLRGYTTELQ